MSNEWTIVPAALLFILAILNLCFVRTRRGDRRLLIISWLLLIQVTVQIAFPCVYGMAEGFPPSEAYNIDSTYLNLVVNLELLFFCCYLFGFHKMKAASALVSKLIRVPCVNERIAGKYFAVLLFASIISFIVDNGSGLPVYGLVQMYDRDNSALLTGSVPILGISMSMWVLVRNLVQTPGLIAGGLLLSMRWTPRWLRPISLVYLLSWQAFGALMGVRAIVLSVVFILTLPRLLERRSLRPVLPLVAGPIIFLAIFGGTIEVYRTASQGTSFVAQDGPLNRIELFLNIRNDGNQMDMLSRAWHGAGARFNDRYFATGLVMAGLEHHAGVWPIVNSLAAPIPRVLWAQKPAPGSVDGTNAGIATFVAPRYVIGPGAACTGFTPGSHAFWEFGLAGVVFAGVFCGLWTRFLAEATSGGGVVGILIWIMSLKPHFYTVELWTPELIRIFLMDLLPLFLFAWLASRLRPSQGVIRAWGRTAGTRRFMSFPTAAPMVTLQRISSVVRDPTSSASVRRSPPPTCSAPLE